LGELLEGKYRLEQVLGAGSVGVVVAAIHEQLGERVAIKFLKPEFAAEEAMVRRFLREARSAVRIKSEYVARVLDVGMTAAGVPYIVMECLVGSDAAAHLAKEGPMAIDTAIEVILQACEAVAEAHCLGIVHRDLKPANLFLTQRADGSPMVKVLDFGTAKIAAANPNLRLTASHSMMGSPMYMSPEQITDAKLADVRSDVWQLGLCLHELLTGSCPFVGRSLSELVVAVKINPPASLTAARSDAPPLLEDVILRCLQKDPNRRTPDVATFAKELLPLVATRRGAVSIETIVGMEHGALAAAELGPSSGYLRGSQSLIRAAPAASLPSLKSLSEVEADESRQSAQNGFPNSGPVSRKSFNPDSNGADKESLRWRRRAMGMGVLATVSLAVALAAVVALFQARSGDVVPAASAGTESARGRTAPAP
jgi:serine/threonine-protein kinase